MNGIDGLLLFGVPVIVFLGGCLVYRWWTRRQWIRRR